MIDEELTVHPFARLVPAMNEDEFQKLIEDIRKNGLLEPITMCEGKILDGRHRYWACQAAAVEPRFVDFEGSDPISYILSKNLHRRHLSAAQRAAIAAEMLPLLEEEAKVRQGSRTDLIGNDNNNFQEFFPGSQARDRAADMVGVNPHYVSDAKRIGTEAPEILDAMRDGVVSMVEAKALAGQPETERRETLEALPSMSRAERKALLRVVRPDPDDEPEEVRVDTARDIIERLFAVLGRIGIDDIKPADASLLTADAWQGSAAREIDDRLARLEKALLEGEVPPAWWRFTGAGFVIGIGDEPR